MDINNSDNKVDNNIDNNILPRIEDNIIELPIVDCPNETALVQMYGWDYGAGYEAGIRILSPAGEAYYYGDEILAKLNGTGVWEYVNNGGYGLIASSLNVTDYPWQASWSSPFVTTKICL